MYRTLISGEELQPRIGDPGWVIVDCRSKVNPEFHGETAYRRAHVTGAVYANLDRDLAAPHVPGKTGRHPLPPVAEIVATFSRLGIDATTQVVAYDDMGGAYAARLWWMLRRLGHDAVAVLDGGWQKWEREGRPVRDGIETGQPAAFVARPRADMEVDADDVALLCSSGDGFVGDARSAERYRGENETLDPVAGHIPGAESMPYSENIKSDWTLVESDVLRRRFGALTAFPPEKLVFYCGSGVTAAHNILAMVHAGLPEPRLYVGSWSEWITDPARPVATNP